MGFKAISPPTDGRLFDGETVQFLIDLDSNNDREWFTDNKQRYEDCVRAPALEFIRRMAPRLHAISPHFEASDRKVGGSLMRVYRDTRFSADKTPYKTNIGIHFRHRVGKDVHAPGLYVHISLDECFLGVGSWRPEAAQLQQIRRRITDAPKDWLAVRDDSRFRKYFELSGASLKRMPRGYKDDHPHADDIRRKDHTALAAFTLDDALDSGVVDYCAQRFAAAAPYLRFLSRAVGAGF